MAPASPALAPWLISGSNRIDPMAPPEAGHSLSARETSWVPESCHARRTKTGPQFFSCDSRQDAR